MELLVFLPLLSVLKGVECDASGFSRMFVFYG